MLAIIFSLSLWMSHPAALPALVSSIEWLTETEYDFGDLPPQKPVQYTFRFKNTGSEPLVIETVRTTCGCTGSTWEETPVLPGATGSITIEYDAKKSGYFRKYAKIYFAGKKGAEKLWVNGFVLGDEN